MVDKDTFTKQMGAFIRRHRQQQHMTIDQLAAKSELPYSQIARIERGRISTSVYTLYRLALALNIDFASFDLGIKSYAPGSSPDNE